MRKLSDWLQSVSTGWAALTALAVFVLFTATVLPQQAAAAEASTGSERSPDMSFYYTGAELYRLAGEYGEAGRAAYIRARFTFDLVWPLVYAAFLTTAISRLFRRAFGRASRWQLANLAPPAGMAFDYLENLSTSAVMARYPAEVGLAAALAPLFTMVKWVLVGGSFALLAVGLAAWVVKRIGRGPGTDARGSR